MTVKTTTTLKCNNCDTSKTVTEDHCGYITSPENWHIIELDDKHSKWTSQTFVSGNFCSPECMRDYIIKEIEERDNPPKTELIDYLIDQINAVPVCDLNSYVWHINQDYFHAVAGLKTGNGKSVRTYYRSALGELFGIPIEIADVPEPVLFNKREYIERLNEKQRARQKRK